MGYTTRQQAEFVIYGRRGRPQKPKSRSVESVIIARVREHSRKPDEFYDVIRRVTTGPRIDVFSRESREGFATYGNEAQKFDEVA